MTLMCVYAYLWHASLPVYNIYIHEIYFVLCFNGTFRISQPATLPSKSYLGWIMFHTLTFIKICLSLTNCQIYLPLADGWCLWPFV
jgi:hypothetical protein